MFRFNFDFRSLQPSFKDSTNDTNLSGRDAFHSTRVQLLVIEEQQFLMARVGSLWSREI